MILVTSSGKLVPKATMVRAIILSLIPNILAISLAESTTKLLPIISPAIPNIVKIIDNKILYFGFVSSSTSVLFLITENK